MSERTHRHELEKNILADWLNEKLEFARPYATQIAVVGLVALVAIIGSIYYFSQADTVGPKAWHAFMSAYGEPRQKMADALMEVYEKQEVRGTSAELWARLAYADAKSELAAFKAVQDSAEAKSALVEAEKALLPIEEKTSDPALLARCRFSLARIYETQNKLDKAREYYKKVIDGSKDSALGKAAATAAARLDPQGQAAQVIGWLAEQKPLPTKTPGSTDSILDSLGPGFGPSPTLPERPNLSIPGTESPFGASGAGIDFGRDNPLGVKGTTPELDAPKGTEPDTKGADGKPDASAEKPASEKPATEKSDAEKPAEPAKAEENKPAAPVKSAEEKPESDKP